MYKTTDKHFKIYFVEGIFVLIDLLSNTGYIIVNKEISEFISYYYKSVINSGKKNEI